MLLMFKESTSLKPTDLIFDSNNVDNLLTNMTRLEISSRNNATNFQAHNFEVHGSLEPLYSHMSLNFLACVG